MRGDFPHGGDVIDLASAALGCGRPSVLSLSVCLGGEDAERGHRAETHGRQ